MSKHNLTRLTPKQHELHKAYKNFHTEYQVKEREPDNLVNSIDRIMDKKYPSITVEAVAAAIGTSSDSTCFHH